MEYSNTFLIAYALQQNKTQEPLGFLSHYSPSLNNGTEMTDHSFPSCFLKKIKKSFFGSFKKGGGCVMHHVVAPSPRQDMQYASSALTKHSLK